MALLANVNRGKNRRPYKPEDFNPTIERVPPPPEFTQRMLEAWAGTDGRVKYHTPKFKKDGTPWTEPSPETS